MSCILVDTNYIYLEFLITVAVAPSDLMLRQNGRNSIEANWTSPSDPPDMGYAISTTDNLLFDIYTNTTSYIFKSLVVGTNLTVHIISRSQHFGSDVLGPMSVIVLGKQIKQTQSKKIKAMGTS